MGTREVTRKEETHEAYRLLNEGICFRRVKDKEDKAWGRAGTSAATASHSSKNAAKVQTFLKSAESLSVKFIRSEDLAFLEVIRELNFGLGHVVQP